MVSGQLQCRGYDVVRAIDAQRNVPGVFFEGRLLQSIPAAEAVELVGAGSFDGGIVPKLLAAAGAARNGLQADIGLTAVIA